MYFKHVKDNIWQSDYWSYIHSSLKIFKQSAPVYRALTRQFFTPCMHPGRTRRTLDHLGFPVVVRVTFTTHRTKVTFSARQIEAVTLQLNLLWITHVLTSILAVIWYENNFHKMPLLTIQKSFFINWIGYNKQTYFPMFTVLCTALVRNLLWS